MGMLSYELLFAEEVGESAKAAERIAAKCLKFAIAPGKYRAMELAKENWISPERIFSIPVSPAHPLPYEKSRYLHKTLGLSDTTKIALYAGSLSDWACISQIIQSVTSWPKDWVLVLHSRYKSELKSFLSEASGSETSSRIYFSKQTEVSLEKMDEILFSATVGLAFYSPTFQDPTSGLNLRTIDLSSGKISTYLQHSLPVITNAEGQIKDLISEYGAGAWVLNPSKIGSVLDSMTAQQQEKMTAGSRKLFLDVLCGQNYRSLLLSLIDSATDSRNDSE